MAGKEQDNRLFIGGLSFEITERQLESAFDRYGKILDCQVMLDRDTGRPRGFGFLTFADRRAMDEAIREMDGREFGDRVISVNRAQPRLTSEEPTHGYGGGGYSSGGRSSYGVGGGGDRSAGQDDCFKCGRPGHWARDCPSAGGARGGAHPLTPQRRFAGAGGRGDAYGGDRDRYFDDRYERPPRFVDRDRYNGRDENRYAGRDRYPPTTTDRFGGDRFERNGGSDRYPHNGYGKERGGGYERGNSDRYGCGGGGPRYEGRSYRDNNNNRPGPYDRPRRGGRAPSFEQY